MKARETRQIRIRGVLCTFKIYDTYVVVVPPINRYKKIVEMIRTTDDGIPDPAIRRLVALAERDWRDIAMFVKPE